MVNDSVGALHVALAAAIVGWLVFCISHSVAVWKKRNAASASRSRGILYVGLLIFAAAVAGGWLNREMTRRAGAILGTDFFVARAHENAIPHLAEGHRAHQSASNDSEADQPALSLEPWRSAGPLLVFQPANAWNPLTAETQRVAVERGAAGLSLLSAALLRPARRAADVLP